jgi:hypothetical protein
LGFTGKATMKDSRKELLLKRKCDGNRFGFRRSSERGRKKRSLRALDFFQEVS